MFTQFPSSSVLVRPIVQYIVQYQVQVPHPHHTHLNMTHTNALCKQGTHIGCKVAVIMTIPSVPEEKLVPSQHLTHGAHIQRFWPWISYIDITPWTMICLIFFACKAHNFDHSDPALVEVCQCPEASLCSPIDSMICHDFCPESMSQSSNPSTLSTCVSHNCQLALPTQSLQTIFCWCHSIKMQMQKQMLQTWCHSQITCKPSHMMSSGMSNSGDTSSRSTEPDTCPGLSGGLAAGTDICPPPP